MVDFVSLSESNLWARKPGPNFISDNFHNELGLFQNNEVVPRKMSYIPVPEVQSVEKQNESHKSEFGEALLWPYYSIQNNDYTLPYVTFLGGVFLLPTQLNLNINGIVIGSYLLSSLEYAVQNQKKENPSNNLNSFNVASNNANSQFYLPINKTTFIHPLTRHELLAQIDSSGDKTI